MLTRERIDSIKETSTSDRVCRRRLRSVCKSHTEATDRIGSLARELVKTKDRVIELETVLWNIQHSWLDHNGPIGHALAFPDSLLAKDDTYTVAEMIQAALGEE